MPGDAESVNFLELACVFKITQDTTLERFGGMINSSVFDAANITGGLKQKGLIDFTAYYPGPNSIVLTDTGKKLKEEVEAKSAEPLDNLDEEILAQMSGGKRHPMELQNTLNIRAKDMALRLYKLFKQNFVSYELKSGSVELMLTEQGFLKAKVPAHAPAQVQPQQQAPAQQQTGAAGTSAKQATVPPYTGAPASGSGNDLSRMSEEIKLHGKPHTKRNLAVAAAVVAALILIAYYYGIL